LELPLALLASRALAADGDSEERGRKPPLPEPMIAESITNIDGTEAGELEFDVEALLLRLSSGGTASGLGVEAEWRATRNLGLAVEAAVTRAASDEPTPGQVRAGLAWSLGHDLARDLHVQAEATARFGGDDEERAEGPLELPHPYSVGLVPLFGAPVDVGLGAPWSPGLRSGERASIGGVLRVVFEP
jgi:hypothetical protein